MSPPFEGGVDPDSHRETGWFASWTNNIVLIRTPPHPSRSPSGRGAPPPQGGDNLDHTIVRTMVWSIFIPNKVDKSLSLCLNRSSSLHKQTYAIWGSIRIFRYRVFGNNPRHSRRRADMYWKYVCFFVLVVFSGCESQKETGQKERKASWDVEIGGRKAIEVRHDPCMPYYRELPDQKCLVNEDCHIDDPCFTSICAMSSGDSEGWCYAVPSSYCPTCDDLNPCTNDFMAHMYLFDRDPFDRREESALRCWMWKCVHTLKSADTCRQSNAFEVSFESQ